jgi:hypothetical protein
MLTGSRPIHITFVMLVLNLLGACSPDPSENGGIPTQTPLVVVVTSETPGTVVSTEPSQDGAAGFPTPFVCRAGVIEQPFEHGRMFWVGKSIDERCREEHGFEPGSGEIWVAIFDATGEHGTWTIFTDSWDESTDSAFDPSLTPPAGLLQPIRGFGRVWREDLSDEQRSAIGWGSGSEIAHIIDYRFDAGGLINDLGTYIPRPGQHTMVSLIGERFFFDEQTQRFDYIPGD